LPHGPWGPFPHGTGDGAAEVVEVSEEASVVVVEVEDAANPTMAHRRNRMAKNFILITLL